MRSFHFALIIFAASFTCFAQVQPANLSERVRSMNGDLLRLHERARGASLEQLQNLRKQAKTSIEQRAAALEELIRQNPDEALNFGFSTELRNELAQLFPDSASHLETFGQWQGEAEYVVLDNKDLKSSKSVIKINTGTEVLDISYPGDAPSGLTCGASLRVSGMKIHNHVAPSDSQVFHTSSTVGATETAHAVSAGCPTTGALKVAVILVTFPGVAPPITATQAYDVFFGTGNRSLNGYWQDASYGATSATGNVFGWYTLPQAYTCDQYNLITTAGMQAAAADVNFANYNSIFYVFPLPSGCAYGGMSTIGCVTQTANGTSFTASNHWIIADYLNPNDQGVELVAHEGGHGLTLNHARSRGFSPLALGPLGVNGTLTEYGDNFDPMGYYNLGHYGAQHKNQIGWLKSSNILNVTGSGTYTVAPIGTSTAGPVALQVQRGTGNAGDYLWIEYHQPTGNYESQLSSAIFGGATIRYLDSITGSGYTNLLDFTPQANNWFDPILPTGQTWTDPYSNLSLTVTSATATAMTVGVTFGTTPCTPGTPTLSVTPTNPTVSSGTSASFALSIKNNDTSSCPTNTYSITSGTPTGWLTSASSSSINLAPGQSGSITVSKAVPAGTTPGTYGVAFNAASTSNSSSATANCSVVAPPPPLSAKLSVPATTYPTKSSVPITVTALSGSAPASGASVTFTVSGPKSATQTVSTSSSGVATWSDKIIGAGTYSVSATVTLGTQKVTTNSASFAVQ